MELNAAPLTSNPLDVSSLIQLLQNDPAASANSSTPLAPDFNALLNALAGSVAPQAQLQASPELQALSGLQAPTELQPLTTVPSAPPPAGMDPAKPEAQLQSPPLLYRNPTIATL